MWPGHSLVIPYYPCMWPGHSLVPSINGINLIRTFCTSLAPHSSRAARHRDNGMQWMQQCCLADTVQLQLIDVPHIHTRGHISNIDMLGNWVQVKLILIVLLSTAQCISLNFAHIPGIHCIYKCGYWLYTRACGAGDGSSQAGGQWLGQETWWDGDQGPLTPHQSVSRYLAVDIWISSRYVLSRYLQISDSPAPDFVTLLGLLKPCCGVGVRGAELRHDMMSPPAL